MHKPLREQTMEEMAMMMLGANDITPHHDKQSRCKNK